MEGGALFEAQKDFTFLLLQILFFIKQVCTLGAVPISVGNYT
jgi:hypothetical protein